MAAKSLVSLRRKSRWEKDSTERLSVRKNSNGSNSNNTNTTTINEKLESVARLSKVSGGKLSKTSTGDD